MAQSMNNNHPQGGERKNVASRSHIWPPHVIHDIQTKAELGRYQIRGFSTFFKIPTLDQLVFLPAALTRLPLEGYRESCDTKTILGGHKPDLVARPMELDIPIYIASMSFGALSRNAKIALGRGATMVGTCTSTGEGGMLEDERIASKKLIYQMTPSRYQLDLEHLRMADAIEIAVGQGAKPGTGGVLLGMKVIDKVVEMRQLPKGIDQRSSVRHPDFLGADDMQIKIEELRDATGYQVPIFCKMPACRVAQDVKIAAKSGVDVIVIDGMEGHLLRSAIEPGRDDAHLDSRFERHPEERFPSAQRQAPHRDAFDVDSRIGQHRVQQPLQPGELNAGQRRVAESAESLQAVAGFR